MIRDFGITWAHREQLLSGLANTVWLSLSSAALAFALGCLLAMALMAQVRPLAAAGRYFVDTMRCVPFLLFAYLVYYGLPSFGIRLTNWGAGLIALTLYNTAYMAELLRAAWAGLPREIIEAGHAFGFVGLNLFRRIVLPPVLLAAMPMIGNQLIQIIKDSAFLTIIAVPELTHEASSIQATYFVPFAAFVTAVLLYWVLCLIVEAAVAGIGRMAEARR
jgi:polar amino acid transport system permease protein